VSKEEKDSMDKETKELLEKILENVSPSSFSCASCGEHIRRTEQLLIDESQSRDHKHYHWHCYLKLEMDRLAEQIEAIAEKYKDDPEAAHIEADKLIIKAMPHNVIKAYNKITKWYS